MRHIDAIKIYEQTTCLIIDDMSEVRGSLKRMLMSFGVAKIDTAATSQQAITLCKEASYGLVLCDYNLGDGQDGQQLLEELRYRKLLRNSSVFLMITAETSRDMVLGALEFLPDDYLSKPITQDMLQVRLNRIVVRHQDLLPIKHEIDNDDFPAAIEQCQLKLDNNGKYTSSYQRLQAELLFRLERFEEAQCIYDASLKNRSLVWAQLGLGKTYLAQGRYAEAQVKLEQVLEQDQRFVEAHDLLAELHNQQADFKQAQQCMENAAGVSPKSVLRQRRLATLAKQNQDPKTSLGARRQVLKFAEHSCHYSPQDYFDISTELLDDTTADADHRKQAKDADMYLKRAVKKHPQDRSIAMQGKAARVKLAMFQGKEERAQALIGEAKAIYGSGGCNPYAELELAEAMETTGDHEGATTLMLKVARENPENTDLVDRVDGLSEEPVSAKGKKMATDLTTEGISHFESKSYDAAIAVFVRATGLFPKHVGLRLNIVHVALTQTKQEEASAYLGSLCRENMTHIGELAAGHRQYPRFSQLSQELNRLYPMFTS